MTSARVFLAVTGTALMCCWSGCRSNRPSTGGSSGAGPGGSGTEVVRTFPATGVSRVVLRATLAEKARIIPGETSAILARGLPQGGAPGYHPADSNWRETKTQDWGLDFRGRTFGQTLVISTLNEITYIHHSYYLDGLVITVPAGVTVVLEARIPSGDGAADLREP